MLLQRLSGWCTGKRAGRGCYGDNFRILEASKQAMFEHVASKMADVLLNGRKNTAKITLKMDMMPACCIFRR